MRNGELIDIDKMDINHLRNALKLIVNNSNKKQPKVFSLNGEMANDFNTSMEYNEDIENWHDENNLP